MSEKICILYEGGHYARLVYGKAKEIFNEFARVFTDTAWASDLKMSFTDGMASELIGIQVEMSLHNACSYYRRIVAACDEFPGLLVFFALAEAGVVCAERKRVARLLLDTLDDDLDISTLKIKILYIAEIRFSAATGTCEGRLFSVGMQFRTFVLVTVKDAEGYNSLIKIQSTRCPNIGLLLLAARVNNKKALGLGTRGADVRWASVRPGAQKLLNECMESCDGATDVCSESGRFSTPKKPTKGIPHKKEMARVTPLLEPILKASTPDVWASKYNSMLHKACSTPSARFGWVTTADGRIANDDKLYLFSEKNYSSTMCTVCSLRVSEAGAGIAERITVRVDMPLRCATAIQIISKLHALARIGVILLQTVELKWDHDDNDVFADVVHITPLDTLSSKRGPFIQPTILSVICFENKQTQTNIKFSYIR